MRHKRWALAVHVALAAGIVVTPKVSPAQDPKATQAPTAAPVIRIIDPPESGFFSKRLDFEGIPIKAHEVTEDAALRAAYQRLEMLFAGMGPYRAEILTRMAKAGVELHIIGRNQVTTDLPEWRQDKGKPLPEYNGLTRDERTRGMGGKLVSCGEENLLKLENDRYRGRDICVHEFAHGIQNVGMTAEMHRRFVTLYQESLAKGRWLGSYAATNPDEFFAELSMWYFGTHGDLGMRGGQPANGPRGLRAYDPDAYAVLDAFYQGRAPASAAPATP